MEKPSPMAMLATAMVWMVEENDSFCPRVIRLDMKEDNFNFVLYQYGTRGKYAKK